MEIYLIFNLKTFNFISKNKNKYLKKSKYIILTDKIFIFNYLKDNNFNVVNLASLIDEKKRNNLFIKFYKFFDKRLKKSNNNFFYNLYRCQVPRDYAGSKLIEFVFKKFISKNKIKKINYFNDLSGKVFTPVIYDFIFRSICKKEKIVYNSEQVYLENFFFSKMIKNLRKIKFFFENLEYIKIKLFLLNLLRFFDSQEKLLVIKPANDLKFLPLVQKKFVYFKKFSNEYTEISKFKIKQQDVSNIENIIFLFLKNEEQKYKKKYEDLYKDIKNFILKKKIKKIFWGLTPTPLMRNVYQSLIKEKFKVYGTQHGGKCFLLKDSTVHSDIEYDYCNYYLSYGVSKEFDYKFIKSKQFNILNVGSLNSITDVKKDSEESNLNNILYLPTPVSHFHCPLIESSQSKFLELQVNICKELNLNLENKSFVKLIRGVSEKITSYDNELLEINPIASQIKKFRNIRLKKGQFKNLIKKLKPKIIVLDCLSTTIYEGIESNSEIILFLDKTNLPHQDVMKKLSSRVFIVKNVKEMKKIFKEIKKKKISKLNNKEFNQEFFYFKEKNFNSLTL